MSDWVDAKLAELTLDEKLSLLSGRDQWHVAGVDRLGIPSLKVTDGPNGARGADGNHGPSSTSFPVGAAMGATWDPDLIFEVGRALAHETKAKGAHVLLGPTVNIPRMPTGGRNFESFSEDPVLSGTLAASYVRGLQGEGVGACIKHFVCNDQEHDRYNLDVVVDERTLHEIYLEPFRIAIDEAKPWAVMSAYNSLNGTTLSENPVLTGVLRDEMGFDGVVISDWYGTYGPGVVGSGLDLEMPGPGRWLAPAAVREALGAGLVTEAEIDSKVREILRLLERTRAAELQSDEEHSGERAEERSLARLVATESIVLLANRGILPLQRIAKLAVIGELAADTPNQGGGSSQVNAHRVVSILEGIRQAVGETVEVTWAPGCQVRPGTPPLDPLSITGDGLVFEYFDGSSPVGVPVRTVTSQQSFAVFFGDGDGWVEYDSFSVRVTGGFRARVAGTHEFDFGAIGRLRVWSGEDLLVDAWSGASNHKWSLPLEMGEVVYLTIEYASKPGVRFRTLGIGCRVPGPGYSIPDAVMAASEADAAIVVAGLTGEWEGEGFDRPDMRLPGDQDQLIAAIAGAQPNTAVVLTTGSAVEMPWADQVAGIVQAWYGGQEVGHAVADVLLGNADPGGRLPVTYPTHPEQHPGRAGYPGEGGKLSYAEGVFVGYRGFDEHGLVPRFGFGYGLSYTTFEAGDVGCSVSGDEAVVSLRLANAGERAGTEVVQVFALGLGGVARRLVGFQKVRLEAGEVRSMTVPVPLGRIRWWEDGGWMQPAGEVILSVRGLFGERSLPITMR